MQLPAKRRRFRDKHNVLGVPTKFLRFLKYRVELPDALNVSRDRQARPAMGDGSEVTLEVVALPINIYEADVLKRNVPYIPEIRVARAGKPAVSSRDPLYALPMGDELEDCHVGNAVGGRK